MTGEVSFVSSYPVQLNIENPDGTPAVSKVNGYYSQELIGEKKNRFSFITADSGRYNVCLKTTKVNSLELHIKLESGVGNAVETEKPKADNKLKVVEHIASVSKNLTIQLQNEMNDLRRTGFEQHNVNRSTTKNVILFGILSVAIIIASAVIQIWYLKRFFKQKKIV